MSRGTPRTALGRRNVLFAALARDYGSDHATRTVDNEAALRYVWDEDEALEYELSLTPSDGEADTYIDEIALERALAGDRVVARSLTSFERLEFVKRGGALEALTEAAA